MKHFKETLALLIAGVAFSASAQRQISDFREIHIVDGQSAQIGGKECTNPDIYYLDKGNGTYSAVRLTVRPQKGKLSDVSLPYLNMATENSICINWKTAKQPTSATVRYGKAEDALDMTVSAESKILKDRESYYWHCAKLTGLEPNTVYYYQVCSGDNLSKVYTFRTMPTADSKDVIRVLLIGDHQRNEHSDYEWMLNAARKTVAEKYGDGPMERHINFLMNVGDQVDTGRLSLYDTVHIYKSRLIAPTLPTMTAVGNHEYFGGDDNLNCYKGYYSGYGNLEYHGITSGTAEYYAYRTGRVLFIVLNSNQQGQSDAQKAWLRKVVATAASDPDVDFITTVQHHPLYAEQWCHDVSSWMNIQIMPILCSTPKHVLNCAGHHHLYARGQMTNSPVYHIISGGGVGTSARDYEQLWSPSSPDPKNHEEVQKTIDQWTYSILEFNPETKEMKVETYSIGNVRLALDNVLIDSFSRKINDPATPEIPEIDAPAEAVELPYEFAQVNANESPYTVQYQVSRTPDFEETLINRIVTAEDCYGVTEDFLPLDLNKDKDISRMLVEAGTVLSNGEYYFRARNRNANLLWSAYSEPVKFSVKNSEVGAVAVDRKFIKTRSNFTVSFAGARKGTHDWVGIYKYGDNPGGPASLKFDYTDDHADGKIVYSIDQPGTYFAGLFINDGYTEIAPRQYFVVSSKIDESKPSYIDTDKKVYSVGDPIVVQLHNVPAVNRDWVGLYDSSIPASTADAKSHSYTYADSDPNGTVKLNVQGNNNFTTPVSDGHYVIAYCMQDDYHEPMGRPSLVVGKPVMVEADQESYHIDEPVRLVYVSAPAWESDKLSVYNSDNQLATEVPAGQSEGFASISGLPAGKYEFCMTTDGDKEISPRGNFEVLSTSAISTPETIGITTVSVNGGRIVIKSATELRDITLYSLNGVRIASPKVSGFEANFNVNVPSGVYILDINGKAQKIQVSQF